MSDPAERSIVARGRRPAIMIAPTPDDEDPASDKTPAGLPDDRARWDNLTGALTREHFLERLRNAFAAAVHFHENLFVLLLDLDRFRSFNERYGHVAGDHALAAVRRRIAAGLGGNDALARVRNDEFAVLCRRLHESEAIALAQGLRVRVSNPPIEVVEGRDPCVFNVSIGVACFPGPRISGPSDLLAAAEGALRTVKAGGGDGVAVARPTRSRAP